MIIMGNNSSINNEEQCSGRGKCICNCVCDMRSDPTEIIFGDACECDNFSCSRDQEGRLCSGEIE